MDIDLESDLGYRGACCDRSVAAVERQIPMEGMKYPTKPLHEDRIDTVFYEETGRLYCKFPENSTVRSMVYNGREQKRNTLKYRCPIVGTDGVGCGCRTLGTALVSPAK